LKWKIIGGKGHIFSIRYTNFFFLNSRKLHLPESALCEPRWVSKTPAVAGSYKRCTSWLELETYCVDLKPFAITLLITLRQSIKLWINSSGSLNKVKLGILQISSLAKKAPNIIHSTGNFFSFLFCSFVLLLPRGL